MLVDSIDNRKLWLKRGTRPTKFFLKASCAILMLHMYFTSFFDSTPHTVDNHCCWQDSSVQSWCSLMSFISHIYNVLLMMFLTYYNISLMLFLASIIYQIILFLLVMRDSEFFPVGPSTHQWKRSSQSLRHFCILHSHVLPTSFFQLVNYSVFVYSLAVWHWHCSQVVTPSNFEPLAHPVTILCPFLLQYVVNTPHTYITLTPFTFIIFNLLPFNCMLMLHW